MDKITQSQGKLLNLECSQCPLWHSTEQGWKNQKSDGKSVYELSFRAQQGPNIIHQNPRAAPQPRQGKPGTRGGSVLLAQQKPRPAPESPAAQGENVTASMLSPNQKVPKTLLCNPKLPNPCKIHSSLQSFSAQGRREGNKRAIKMFYKKACEVNE